MNEQAPKPLIVAAFADDSARRLTSLGKEHNSLEDILKQAARDGRCERVLVAYATADRMLDTLQDYRNRIAVLHYAGHADSYALLMQSAGGVSRLHAGGFAAFLAEQRGPELVFLNACSTEGQVQALLDVGVRAVIATSQAIDDAVAAVFAARFYKGLLGGATVRAAYGEAASSVRAQHGSTSRNLYAPEAHSSVAAGRWPWALYPQDAGEWTLLDAAMRLHPLLQPEIECAPFEPQTVLIPAGLFLMGSVPGPGVPEDETPQHEVYLPAYRIGTYPVTSRQYAAFVQDRRDRAAPRGWFNREPPSGRGDHPVTDVSWHDAAAYCAWLSQETDRHYLLPSEVEWEKAASWATVEERGSVGEPKRRYPWGPEWLDTRCNVGGREAMVVTAHPSGASAYGVEDLLGNVQEWTRSLWGERPDRAGFRYPYDAADGREILDPAEMPARARLVHRGGSFKSPPADVRCTARGNSLSESQVAWRGFRVAMTIA